MYVLVLITQLLQPNLANQVQVNYEVVARYSTRDACTRAKATAIKNDTVVAKHAYECLPVDTE
jgi:hypothetical protein